MVVFIISSVDIGGRRGAGVGIAAVAVDVLPTLSRFSLDALEMAQTATLGCC